MKRIFPLAVAGLCATVVSISLAEAEPAAGPLTPLAIVPPVAAKLADKLPIVTFAQLPFVEYATISPDGTHWAGLFAIGGVQTIAVLSLFDKAEKPARVSLPDRTNARTLRWVNDDNVIVGLDALESIEGDDWYISRTVDRADIRKGESLLQPFMFLNDGDHALVTHDNEHGMSGIYEINLATRQEIRAVHTPSVGEVADPIVSRDRATLLGATSTAAAGGTHWFDSQLAQLQTQLSKAVPTARVGIESMSRDRSRMLIRISDADMPGAMYYYDIHGGVLHRLAYLNEQIGARHLAPVKLISYQARDGLDIEGILTLPVGRVPQQLPFIVMPHGGPWGQDTEVYDYWTQFLANRGYAVLQPNYRGSTGYGTEFLHKAYGQLGLAMQDDVTDGVKWAVSQGLADPKRVCIVGASYGGYSAMWGIAKDPDPYRCAISIAGVASLKREVNDFANELYGQKYRDDWKRLAPDFDAVSPINAVERIKTPLLLIHGKKDVTVAYAHSQKMYDRMRKAGKNVEFVSLPLADHHYRRQEDRVTLLTAMETFLNKYNPAD